jgi:hypothetical protein
MVVSYISHGHSTQSLSGFVLLCTTSDDQHCNAIWIELKCNSYLMELSSNILNGIWFSIQFNSIQFNYWIKIRFKRNGMQIYGEDIENLLAIMLLERKKRL